MRKLILTAAVLLLVLGALYLLFSRPAPARETQQQPTIAAPSETTTPEQATLQGLAGALGVKPAYHDYDYMDWLDKSRQPLPLTGKQFIVGTVDINGIGKFGDFSTDDLNKITVKNLSPLLTATERYFAAQGYTKNAENTRVRSNPPMKTAYYGYEKGTQKCVIRIDELTDPFGNFVCGTINTRQAALQKEFRSLFFEPSVQKNSEDSMPIISFRVQKVENNYALGNASGDISGYTWMARKVNGTWQIVWRGNDIATCTDMRKAGIPKSIYGNCYEEQNDTKQP